MRRFVSRAALVLALPSLLLVGCNKVPRSFRGVVDEHDAEIAALAKDIRARCARLDPRRSPAAGTSFDRDASALDVEIECNDGKGYGYQFPRLRPGVAKAGLGVTHSVYPVVRTKEFPAPNVVRVPSSVVSDPAAGDVCVRDGDLNADYAEVCVAYRGAS